MDSFKSLSSIQAGGGSFQIHRLKALIDAKVGHVDRLPFSLKILLENLLRQEDGVSVTKADIQALTGGS